MTLLSLGALLALLGVGCSSTLAVHRPLSETSVADINAAVAGTHATVVLTAPTATAVAHVRAIQAAARDACTRAPGQGNRSFSDSCHETGECECGLTCQSGVCLGTSLKTVAEAASSIAASVQAKDVKVGRESTQWVEQWSTTSGEWRPSGAPTAALKSISVRQHGLGALEGVAIGLFIGVGAGALLGYSAGSSNSEVPRDVVAAAGAVVGGLSGLVLGAIIGGAAGHTRTIEFDDR